MFAVFFKLGFFLFNVDLYNLHFLYDVFLTTCLFLYGWCRVGDKRSYAEVVKEANQQLDNMTGEGSQVVDALTVGKKKEEGQKKVKTLQSVPDLKEGGVDPMWSAAAAAAGEEFNEAERDASSSSEEVCGINDSCLPIKNVVLIGNDF